MAYDDEEESNLFYRKSVLHALKLKRVVNLCFFVFFFSGMKNTRRTTTRQRRNRVTTEEKILLPVHCFKMNTGITFRRQFSLFS